MLTPMLTLTPMLIPMPALQLGPELCGAEFVAFQPQRAEEGFGLGLLAGQAALDVGAALLVLSSAELGQVGWWMVSVGSG